MPLGTAHMTRTTSDKFIPDIWPGMLRESLLKKLMLVKLVRNWSFTGQAGDVVHIPDVSELAANDKVANTQVTLQAPTETEFTMTINKHKETSFMVEDIARIQSKWSHVQLYVDRAAHALAKVQEEDVWALHATLTNRTIGSTNSASTLEAYDGSNEADLTEIGLRNMIQKLWDGDVPVDDLRLVVPPSQWNALIGIPRFTEAQTIGSGDALRTANIGQVLGVPVYISTMSPIDATDARVGLLFNPEAIVFATQLEPKAESQRKTEYLGDLQVIHTIYATAIFRQTHAIAFYVPV